MTREEVLAMEAGPAMDQLVAELIMGWHRNRSGYYTTEPSESFIHTAADPSTGKDISTGWRWQDDYDYYACGNECERFDPSRDMTSAWVVVEKEDLSMVTVDDGWMVGVLDDYTYTNDDGCVDGNMRPHVVAKDAPLAICRAALLTKVEG